MMDYRVGSSIIRYHAFGGQSRIVRVTSKQNDLNGESGFFGIELDFNLNPIPPILPSDGVWGYDHQVYRVLQY